MADRKMVALQQALATAESFGDTERAARLRKRMGGDAPAAQPAPDAPAEEATDAGNGLDAVQFASPAARAAAEEAGMDAESFKRKRKSSESGFTKADVERLAGAGEEEGE